MVVSSQITPPQPESGVSPPLWSVEERPRCFVVCDQDGQQVACVYFEGLGERAVAKLPSREDARRIAANIARLPILLRDSGTAEE